MSKTSRSQEGKSGGVIGLIYMSAIVVLEGITILGDVGGQYSDWCKLNQVGLTRSIKPDPKLLNVHYVTNNLCSFLFPALRRPHYGLSTHRDLLSRRGSGNGRKPRRGP